jgi:hypothetical protein
VDALGLIRLVLEIKRDTRCSSRAIDAVRHKNFELLKKFPMDEVLSLLFTIVDVDPNAHTMTMIQELTGGAVEIPVDERGYIQKMGKRFSEHGRKKGYI